MKLPTYLEEGRFRTGIQDAVALLEAQAARVYWRTPWSGPWGVLTAPAEVFWNDMLHFKCEPTSPLSPE